MLVIFSSDIREVNYKLGFGTEAPLLPAGAIMATALRLVILGLLELLG
jgi:hypothetical protein